MPTEKVVYLGRNPFARTDLVRRTVLEHDCYPRASCSWCGSKRKSGNMFEYGLDCDGSRGINWMEGVFCSVSCFVAYHDFPKEEF